MVLNSEVLKFILLVTSPEPCVKSLQTTGVHLVLLSEDSPMISDIAPALPVPQKMHFY